MNREKTTNKTMTVSTLIPFVIITFALTWGIALLLMLFPDQIVALTGEVSYTNPLYIVAVYGPAFAAIFLVLRYYGLRGLGSFLRRLTLVHMPVSWWVFIVAGVPALFYLAAAFAGTLTDPFPFEPWYSVFPALLFMLILGPVEEFGWRGLGLPLLQRRFNPLWSSLIIGLIWGIWHLPSFFIGGTPHSEWVFLEFFVGVIALSIIMTAIFNASRGSILTVALLHFQLNNPIWPDVRPWDMILFSIVAIIVVLLNREKMLTCKDCVTGVLMPGQEEKV